MNISAILNDTPEDCPPHKSWHTPQSLQPLRELDPASPFGRSTPPEPSTPDPLPPVDRQYLPLLLPDLDPAGLLGRYTPSEPARPAQPLQPWDFVLLDDLVLESFFPEMEDESAFRAYNRERRYHKGSP